MKRIKFYLGILKEEPIISTYSTDINDYYETLILLINEETNNEYFHVGTSFTFPFF